MSVKHSGRRWSLISVFKKYTGIIYKAISENLKIKACDRTESGVYTNVNEHLGEGSNAEFGIFGG